MRSCEEYQELISAMLDGELTESELAEITAHVADCPACKAMYEAFAAVSAVDAVDVPDTLHAAVMTKVGAAQKALKTQNKLVRLRPILTTAACLVVIVGTLFAARTAMNRGASASMEAMTVTAAAGVEEVKAEAPKMAMAAPAAADMAEMPAEAPAPAPTPAPTSEETAMEADATFAYIASDEPGSIPVQKDDAAEDDATEPTLLCTEVTVTEINTLGFFATMEKGVNGVGETGATVDVRLSGDTVRRDNFVPKAGDSVFVEFSVWDEGAIPVIYAARID